MARLTGSLYTPDDSFRTDVATLLRTTSVQVSLGDERSARTGAPPDIIFVDGRVDLDGSLEAVQRLRAEHPVAVILFMAAEANPDLILQAMRAGANEFFAWPPSRSALDEALQRAAARRAASPSGGTGVDDDRVLRRQRGRRHDDDRRQLRRGYRAAAASGRR